MTSDFRAWWGRRSPRFRRLAPLLVVLLLLGLSFWAGALFGGGGRGATATPTEVAGLSPTPTQSASPGPSPSESAFAAESTSPSATTSPAGTAQPSPSPAPRPTVPPTPGPTATPAAPATPPGLTGFKAGNHINLSWNTSAGAVSYNVYRGVNGGSITLLARGVLSPSYKDLTVSSGHTYAYQVSAVGPNGAESGRSAVVSVTF